MAVTSSLTQAYSISESGGSGISTSLRTSAVAPTVTMSTSATGVDIVYTTRLDMTASGTVIIDLYDTNLGTGDADDRGSIRFDSVHGYIINCESGTMRIAGDTGETPPANNWTFQPTRLGGTSQTLTGPASFSCLNTATSGSVSSTSRNWRFTSLTDCTGSITIIGQGTIL